jgi:hypothetical protein
VFLFDKINKKTKNRELGLVFDRRKAINADTKAPVLVGLSAFTCTLGGPIVITSGIGLIP